MIIPPHEVLQLRRDRRKQRIFERKFLGKAKRKYIKMANKILLVSPPTSKKPSKIKNTIIVTKIKLPTPSEITKQERCKLVSPCLNCGNPDLRLINLHHINKTKYPNMVIPLCWNCHMLLHRLAGLGHKLKHESAIEALQVLKDDKNKKVVV